MHQRSKYQKMQRGEQSSMTDERIARLEELGFDWGKTNTPWDESYAKLQEYKEQHGNCLVPRTYEADQPFAKWVKTQRSEYQKMQRGEQSSMTDERIARLEELGFDCRGGQALWFVRSPEWFAPTFFVKLFWEGQKWPPPPLSILA
jgi:hypothetical protein